MMIAAAAHRRLATPFLYLLLGIDALHYCRRATEAIVRQKGKDPKTGDKQPASDPRLTAAINAA